MAEADESRYFSNLCASVKPCMAYHGVVVYGCAGFCRHYEHIVELARETAASGQDCEL